MVTSRGARLVLLALAAAITLIGATASAQLPPLIDCDGPAGDPDPATDANGWRPRDLVNMICATQPIQDEYTNPAFFLKFEVDETPRTYSDNVLDQLREPTRPRITLAQWIPGGTTADPYRVPEDWEAAGRGRVQEISFTASDGAKLVGRIFAPNATNPPSKLPAIVITTGSIQGYQELYNWAAEGLAEAGYLVLAYDVQGQGRSETFPHNPDGSFACTASGCSGVPFQPNYKIYQGTGEALVFLLSPANPAYGEVDTTRIGVAGHSLGAQAVSVVGQSYPG